MERPCQAGTEGAAADAGSNPGKPISTFKAGPMRLTSGLRPGLGLGPAKQLSLTHPPTPESRGRKKSGGWGDSGQGPRGTTLGSASRQRGPRLRAGAHPTGTRGPAGRRLKSLERILQGPQETSGDCHLLPSDCGNQHYRITPSGCPMALRQSATRESASHLGTR